MTDALVKREGLDPQALIAKALEAGAGIDTVERLVALAKDVREVQAKEAWYAAMAEFQKTCPPIYKTAEAKIGTRYTYRYAPLDEILGAVQPVMGPLGLSVSWRTVRADATQVVMTCRVSHRLGHHEESGEIAMPVVEGDGSGANPMQRVGIAATYAKRYALLGIIGLAPEDDDDAESAQVGDSQGAREPADSGSSAPAVISEQQIKKFWAIARGSGWDEAAIKAKWPHVAQITASGYDAALQVLKAGPPK